MNDVFIHNPTNCLTNVSSSFSTENKNDKQKFSYPTFNVLIVNIR